MLPSFMTSQSFSRDRYAMIEDHGTLVPDTESPPTSVTFYGSVQPAQGEVDMIGRDGAEIAYVIWAPPETDVEHQDLITFRGKQFYVNGSPEEWMTGVLDHMVIRISRWLG